MKIAIVNQPLRNRGDEAAHKAFLHILTQEFPQTKIDIIFIGQSDESINQIKISDKNIEYINISGIRGFLQAEKVGLFLHFFSVSLIHPLLFKFKKLLKKYDYIICAPGGICMGGFMNWDHVWQLLLAKKMHKKIIYWGRSIGPFTEEDWKHKLFKKISYELMHYFSFFSVRDAYSLEIANNIGVKVVSTVDSAFLYTPSVVLPDEINSYICGKKYMVMVPNELIWHYRYKNVNPNFINLFYFKIMQEIFIDEPDITIVMLPQLYNQPIDDKPYFIYLKNMLVGKKIIVLDDKYNSDIQQKIISGAEYIIGTRYHSIIFAINNACPFISLSYEHKMSGLLNTLGCTQTMVDISEIFVDEKHIEEAVLLVKTNIKKRNNLVMADVQKKAKEIAQNSIMELKKKLTILV